MASQFDWQYILDNLPDLFAGWLMTLRLSLISIVISMLLGAILASMQLAAPNGKIAALIKGYVAFIRNTPLLLQIFFIYFGLPEVGLKLSPFNSGILALSLWAIAFNSENFRAGLAAVPHGLNEASQALGLSSLLYTAIGVVKNSSYMQVVGIAELTFVAVDKVSLEFKTVEMFSAITIIYILTVFLLSMLFRLMETRMNHPFVRG
ncbi:L-cystine transport system permease protein YecS [Sodalis praecaptivus]